ncbi:hypothetical protein B0T25DRAFT_571454 [Lasiosphaeria hispida]|uniref:Chitin synthase regulatory factor 4 n=1 Tax=Lasiosphaeria hispida TaxID=260671 RepID=A0AAJ0MAL5_9PEZI|nr:hypothetical protein B0T25DRAFT_571454 [Lasiosphaeria hispida]
MPPQLGATFVPGGNDDFYMPEVIAPAPQRVMPEVPQNMQNDLQRMELEARTADRRRDTNQGVPSQTNTRHTRNYSTEDSNSFKPFPSSGAGTAVMETPSFSPFPKVRGENIPPNDEEKEQILWQARSSVLHSNNVSMQVTWARDTLLWVEAAADAHARDWKREGRGRERPPTPKTEHNLRLDAVNIIDYLATQEHPEATFMKGKWLEFGKFGFRENKIDAFSHYKKSAENGYGRAEYRLGMLYENSNKIQKSIEHYTHGIKLGDSASSYRLGMMHLLGQHGHQKDFLQGLELIQKAAETADEDAPQGAYVYGMLIARELPDITIPESILPFELGVARQYIEKAAYLSFAKAQLKMGQAYELSQLGCDFNPAYSLHYYGLAARQGQPEAALGVSRWFLFGYENVFPKNEQLAFRYAQDAAIAGLATGEFAMGYYHEIGIHVQKDLKEARRWYELAAEHGNKDAKGRVESLSQSKTLTKQDHETTTLTRIKSQYGSQRGKRPDRFARQGDILPALVESGPTTPVDNVPPIPGKPSWSPQRKQPTIVEDKIDFPDPERSSTMNSRPPAFTVNLDPALAVRSKSTAPYPEDDRPPPLTLRPKSTAPYPDDEMLGHRPPLSPHFNPGIRPSSSSGPAADRPMSAFGIRPVSPNSGPQTSQLGAQLGAGRGRPQQSQPSASWAPQVPSGYRPPSAGQPSPSHPRQDYRTESAHWQAKPLPQQQQQQQQQRHDLPSQRLGANSVGPGATVPVGAALVNGDPNRARLQKTNPNLNKPQPSPQGPPGQLPGAGYGSQFDTAGAPSGRDYGARHGNRPANDRNDNYDRHGALPPPAGSRLPGAGGNGNFRPERTETLPVGGAGGLSHPSLPPGGGAPLKQRPGLAESMAGGRNSAPPAQSVRPGSRPSSSHGGNPGAGTNSPAPSVASTTKLPGHGPPRPGGKPAAAIDHPGGKTMGQGPATFEEMGIPQGKGDSDCIVM